MNPRNIVLYEPELARLRSILSRTRRDMRADLVFLIDKSGHPIASEGESEGIDLTALASLAAANLAATDGLARLVGEPEFSILYHQGRHRSIHISTVYGRFSLVVVFDETVSLGLVRLRVRHATAYIEEIFRGLANRAKSEALSGAKTNRSSPLNFTDEEIDSLFNDQSSEKSKLNKG